jgi:hypothetical protein
MARGPVAELRDALERFGETSGRDHRFRHVHSALRDVHSALDQLPDHMIEADDRESDDQPDDGQGRERRDRPPRSFREARTRSRDKLAESERDTDDDSATGADSSKERRGATAQEDS